jgi:CBS domain-containing protein
MKVSEVMTRTVECVTPDDTIQNAARKMRDLDIGPLPVMDQDKPIGIVTDRDITIRSVAEGRDPKDTRVSEAITRLLFCCYEDDDVKDAARLMAEKQVRRLVVLDRDDRLAGIVSLGDIATDAGDEKLTGQVLEEISQNR